MHEGDNYEQVEHLQNKQNEKKSALANEINFDTLNEHN